MFRPYTDTTLRKFDISADGGQTWTTQWMTFSEMKAEFQRYNFTIYYDVLQRCDKCGTLFHFYYNTADNHTAYWNKCDCEAEFHPYSPDQPTFAEFMEFLTAKTASPTLEDMNSIAHNISEFLKYAHFDDITDSSGYFAVKVFPDGSFRAVDVHKSTGNGIPHYSIFCLYEDGQSDWKYTVTLSAEELAEVLKEVYTDDTGMEPDEENAPIEIGKQYVFFYRSDDGDAELLIPYNGTICTVKYNDTLGKPESIIHGGLYEVEFADGSESGVYGEELTHIADCIKSKYKNFYWKK